MGYQAEKLQAQSQIKEDAQGATVTITRQVEASYDPLTQIATPGAAITRTGIPAVELPLNANDVAQLPAFRLGSSRAKILIAALELPGFEPRPEDKIRLAGRSVDWTIVTCKPLRPDGTPIMYTLFVSDGAAQ